MKLVRQSILEREPFRSLEPRISTPAAVGSGAGLRVKGFTAKHEQQERPKKLEQDRSLLAAARCNRIAQQHSGGGTRWNPTAEQIEALEAMYRDGMRTPNARQIEQITAELCKHGKIEGKNVFYWFQNHKARERQKQKRDALVLGLGSGRGCAAAAPSTSPAAVNGSGGTRGDYVGSGCKRRCRSWSTPAPDEGDGGSGGWGGGDKTLELFPLHPEGRKHGFSESS